MHVLPRASRGELYMALDPNAYFAPTYVRNVPAMVKAKGMYVYDENGKKYLDFGSGIAVTALGHGHPSLLKVLREQGKQLLHVSNYYYTQSQIDLARLLVKHSFGDKVFLCNSGTEAVEAAIKFARKWASQISKKKYHVLSFRDGFHGRTYGALAATAQEKFHKNFGPMPSGFHYAPYNDIKAAQKVLAKHEFAAVIVEPLQGEGGLNQASGEFLRFLREYADTNKVALIFDEIQCGMGRTGTLWYYEQLGVVPDLMTLAKPVGGGLPLGVVVSKEAFVSVLAPGDHGTTFGGNPLACALGAEVLSTVAKKSFLADVRKKGTYLQSKLQEIAELNPATCGKVVGAGLMTGIRLRDADPVSVVGKCKDAGLFVIRAGYNTVRFLPPLTVSKADIDKAVKIFARVLEAL